MKSKITFNILVIYAQLKCTLQRRISRICNLGAGANYSLKITLKFNVKCVFNLQCNKVYYRQQKWVNTVCQWWMSKSTTVNKNTLLLFLYQYVFNECIPENVDYLSADQVFTYKSTMNVYSVEISI